MSKLLELCSSVIKEIQSITKIEKTRVDGSEIKFITRNYFINSNENEYTSEHSSSDCSSCTGYMSSYDSRLSEAENFSSSCQGSSTKENIYKKKQQISENYIKFLKEFCEFTKSSLDKPNLNDYKTLIEKFPKVMYDSNECTDSCSYFSVTDSESYVYDHTEAKAIQGTIEALNSQKQNENNDFLNDVVPEEISSELINNSSSALSSTQMYSECACAKQLSANLTSQNSYIAESNKILNETYSADAEGCMSILNSFYEADSANDSAFKEFASVQCTRTITKSPSIKKTNPFSLLRTESIKTHPDREVIVSSDDLCEVKSSPQIDINIENEFTQPEKPMKAASKESCYQLFVIDGSRIDKQLTLIPKY